MADSTKHSRKSSKRSLNYLESDFRNPNDLLLYLLRKRGLPQSNLIFGNLSPKNNSFKFPVVYVKAKQASNEGNNVHSKPSTDHDINTSIAPKSKRTPLRTLETGNTKRAEFHPAASSTPQINSPRSPNNVSLVSSISRNEKERRPCNADSVTRSVSCNQSNRVVNGLQILNRNDNQEAFDGEIGIRRLNDEEVEVDRTNEEHRIIVSEKSDGDADENAEKGVHEDVETENEIQHVISKKNKSIQVGTANSTVHKSLTLRKNDQTSFMKDQVLANDRRKNVSRSDIRHVNRIFNNASTDITDDEQLEEDTLKNCTQQIEATTKHNRTIIQNSKCSGVTASKNVSKTTSGEMQIQQRNLSTSHHNKSLENDCEKSGENIQTTNLTENNKNMKRNTDEILTSFEKQFLYNLNVDDSDIADDVPPNSQPKWLQAAIEERNNQTKINKKTMKRRHGQRKIKMQNIDPVKKSFLDATEKLLSRTKSQNSLITTRRTLYTKGTTEDPEDSPPAPQREKQNADINIPLNISSVGPVLNSEESQKENNMKSKLNNKNRGICTHKAIIKIKRLKNYTTTNLKTKNVEQVTQNESKPKTNQNEIAGEQTKDANEIVQSNDVLVDVANQNQEVVANEKPQNKQNKRHNRKKSSKVISDSDKIQDAESAANGIRRSTRPHRNRAYWMSNRCNVEETDIYKQLCYFQPTKITKKNPNKNKIENSKTRQNKHKEKQTNRKGRQEKNEKKNAVVQDKEIFLEIDEDLNKEVDDQNVNEENENRFIRNEEIIDNSVENDKNDEVNVNTENRIVDNATSFSVPIEIEKSQNHNCHKSSKNVTGAINFDRGSDNDEVNMDANKRAAICSWVEESSKMRTRQRVLRNRTDKRKLSDSGNTTEDEGAIKSKFPNPSESREEPWIDKMINCEWKNSDKTQFAKMFAELHAQKNKTSASTMRDLVVQKMDENVEYAYYTPDYGYLRIHSHREKKTSAPKQNGLIFLVLSGKPNFHYDEKINHCSEGDCIQISKGSRYKIQNNTDHEVLLFFFKTYML